MNGLQRFLTLSKSNSTKYSEELKYRIIPKGTEK